MTISIDHLIRSRRRSIALTVRLDGSVEVRAPYSMRAADIQAFVQGHADWVQKQRLRARKHAPPPPKQFTPGEAFLYLGKSYPLTITPRQRHALIWDGNSFHLARAFLPRAKEAFTRWYKIQIADILSTRLPEIARKYKFTYQKVRISSARTRWGSCSTRGTLSFTWRLVMAPMEIVEYVLIHELAHIRQPNHSPAFWHLVESILPDFKSRRAWLKKNGKYLALD